MPAAHSQLLANHAFAHGVAQVHFHPRTHGIAVGPGLLQAQLQPVAHGLRPVCRARAHVAPELRLVPAVDHQHVQQAIAIQVGQHAAAPAFDAGNAGLLPGLHKAAIGLLQQQVVGVQRGEVRHAGDVALDDEKIGIAVMVDIGKLRVPGSGRVHVATHVRPVRGDAAFESHVTIRGLCRC